MAEQTTNPNADTKDARIRDLTEENQLLLEQLHVVQEELEKYYYRLRDCEQRKDSATAGPVVVIPPEADEALTENLKLRALVEQQRTALRVEGANSLAARLGSMLIDGVSSAGSFISLPVRLCRMWKAADRSVPPAELGGKSFLKVLDAHASGGMEAVEKLLDSIFLSPAMRANAYTALARHLMPMDARQAADLARLAWETDPRAYRLKWLAFRVHEADDAVSAEALLDMLPEEVSMSESEQRQAVRLRQQSLQERSRQTRNATEAVRVEAAKLQETMTKLRTSCEVSRKQQAEAATQLNQLREGHKKELAQRDKRIAELQKAADQARQEASRASEARASMQRQMEAQKKESDALALQTGLMLKTMLTDFESDTPLLSRLMRIVMGSTAGK